MAKFRKGESGNPSGKPKGCRNATTILFDELLKANARELIEKAIEMAKNGDGPALRLCIDRLAPARKDRPVWFDLPKMNEARDAVNASAAIVAAVAGGDLTPSEAAELSKVVDGYARFHGNSPPACSYYYRFSRRCNRPGWMFKPSAARYCRGRDVRFSHCNGGQSESA
jgi:hypothetical protein